MAAFHPMHFLAALALSAATFTAQAQSTYSLTHLDDIDFPFDLNDQGEIVGRDDLGGSETNPLARAVLWRNGQIVPLGDLMGGQSPHSEATGINDRSEIAVATVVIEDGQTHRRGFIWKNGQRRDLGVPPGMSSVSPADINNRGQIVGATTGEVSLAAFLWHRGRISVVDGPSDFGAHRINRRGDILFSVGLSHDGAFTAFVPPPDAESIQSSDLNDHGQVAGSVSYTDGSNRAMLWQGGQVTLLPQLDPSQFPIDFASGINDRGRIVGLTADADTGASRAVLWLDGNPYSLMDLIRADDPLKPFVTLRSAHAINNRGQIIAGGADSRDPADPSVWFLLTPRD